MLTMLSAVVRRLKTNYAEHGHRSCRLVLIADNCGDNKNNTLLAWCLVHHGWFDCIELLFGLVGHTHNGVDADHCIHNDKLGNLESFCFGQLLRNYPKVFHDEDKRPRASMLDCMFDWDAHFRPYVRQISGFTKTAGDEHIVRGWRTDKNKDGVVQLKWKADPALEKEWRGIDGRPCSDGFFIMKGVPAGSPKQIPPKTEGLLQDKYLATMTGKSMLEIMTAHGAPESVEYNMQCARTGVVPVAEWLDDSCPPGEWGRAARVGCSLKRLGTMRMIEKIWPDNGEMWVLPHGANDEHVAATTNAYHYTMDAAIQAAAPTALVRYSSLPASRAPIYSLPANVAHRREQEQEADEPAANDEPAADEPAADESAANEVPQHAGGEHAGDDAGGPVGSDKPFSVPFEPKKRQFALVMAEYDGLQGLAVNKIISINRESKSMVVKPLYCVAKPWTKQALDSAWHLVRGSKTGNLDHTNVVKYFDRLKKDHKFKTSERKYIDSCCIEWVSRFPLFAC